MTEIKITFDSVQAKDAFLGGLIDGWGENDCQLSWEKGKMAFEVSQFHCKRCDGYEPETPESLEAKGWTVRRQSLYDEEGIEGWVWTDPEGKEHAVIGDWAKQPPMPEE